jgi:hypothetical protein
MEFSIDIHDGGKMNTDKLGNRYWRNQDGLLHREDGPAFFGPGDFMSNDKSANRWRQNRIHRS